MRWEVFQMDSNLKRLNFDDPSWKDPEDFLIPSSPQEGELPELLKKMGGSGKEAKLAAERIKTGLKEYLKDVAVAGAENQRQLGALLSRGCLALDAAVDSFQGDPKTFSDLVKNEIKRAIESITPAEEAALLKKLEQKKKAKAAQRELEGTLRDEMADMAVRFAHSNKEYLALLWKGKHVLQQAIDSFKGDRKNLESFVRAEVKRAMSKEK
ncbi:MAG: hypothetical protein A3G87_00355 [Omnitrophica bacterium RIFCSPLOWO2_12_FULL_50_11]|nr:MAG: hypothetical protein A3G87_00355 [Omnitrophica bacterium RIFCSPLOWO2_12_FULL_50_11]